MPLNDANDNNFKQLLSDNDKVVVKYYADWCGSCRLFAPKFSKMADDPRFADITFLDINSEMNEEARKIASVDNLPFFAVFKNGKLLETLATSKEERVIEMLEKLF
jgi:thiol-disulfide isomerase/thioredoxin